MRFAIRKGSIAEVKAIIENLGTMVSGVDRLWLANMAVRRGR